MVVEILHNLTHHRFLESKHMKIWKFESRIWHQKLGGTSLVSFEHKLILFTVNKAFVTLFCESHAFRGMPLYISKEIF